ncbi:MAG: TlpA family protein disulfide reductase [Gemmatimonadota bacterium]|nr:TlpA family protein disulfide reductase [Gemmatimonadota bacterium]
MKTASRNRSLTWPALLALAAVSACELAENAGPPQIGRPAREYSAATLAGEQVTLESMRGRVVLLNLWATWCTPCRMETPYLQSIYEERRDEGFEIVGISMDTGNAADDVAMFVDEYGVSYTILHDPQMRGMELYSVLGLPATFLIDRDGVLRWMRYGPIPEDDPEFLAALEDALS